MVNYFAVIAAAVAVVILGFLWYSKFLFGKLWMKFNKIKAKKKKDMWKPAFMFLGQSLVTAYVLALFLEFLDATSYTAGLITGFLLWLGFIATTTFSSIIWGNRTFKSWLLDNGYNLLSVLVMAAILIAWV